MSDEFRASKRTTLKALQAMRDAEYPKRQGEKADSRKQWQEHHNACMSKLQEMLLEGRYQ